MSKDLTIQGEALGASRETTLAIEQFLNDNYLFRRNVLNGKVEFLTKPAESSDKEPSSDYRPLTQEALNSIIRRAKKEDICEKGSPKTEIVEFVHSEDVPIHLNFNLFCNDNVCFRIFAWSATLSTSLS